MCTLFPVTIYGTTQITTSLAETKSIESTYDGQPVISLWVVQTEDCDILGCRQAQRTLPVTVTPKVTTTIATTTLRQVVLTSVVPQQTVFQSCIGTTTSKASSTTRMEDVETFNSPTHVPSSSFQPQSDTLAQMSETTFVIPTTSSTVRSTNDQYAASGSTTAVTSKQRQLASLTTSASLLSLTNVPSSLSPSDSSAGEAAGTTSVVSPSSSTSTHNTGAVAGGIAGGIIALVLLCAVITYLRRAKTKSEDRSLTTTEDYWERHFQVIEAGVNEKDDGKSEVSGKKLRLTLDLGPRALSMRTSRLSSISSYFLPKSSTSNQQKRPDIMVGPVDFSRPSFAWRRHSRSSSSKSGTGCGSTEMPDPMSCVVVDSAEVDGRKGMEWMRAEEFDDDSGLRVEDNGGYPAIALHVHRLSRMSHQQPGLAQARQDAPWTRTLVPPRLVPVDRSPFTDPQKTSPSYPSPPARSFSFRRQSMGKPKPGLTRAGITPSMWVDESAYDEFIKGASRFSPDFEDPYSGADFGTPSAQSIGSQSTTTHPECSAVTPRLPVLTLDPEG